MSNWHHMFDWQKAIATHSHTILVLLAAFFDRANIDLAQSHRLLPRDMRNGLLRLLRPAESAVRRLIILAARNIKYKPPKTLNHPLPDFKSFNHGNSESPARFALFDPLKRFSLEATTANKMDDKIVWRGVPRICVPHLTRALSATENTTTPENTMVGVRDLLRRYEALKHALDTLPQQAKRLARYRTKRLEKRGRKAQRLSPLRPGFPPGYRQKPSQTIDHILAECHTLALFAMEPADTS